MKEFIKIFGVKFDRKLRWYEYVIVAWITISLCLLTFDADTTPLYIALLLVLNFILSVIVGSQLLPDIKDDEED